MSLVEQNKVTLISKSNTNLKAETTIPICSGEEAIVNIRPTNNYDGSFGFDWLRSGDTNLFGDTDYKGIMGWTDGNDVNHSDTSQHTQLKDSFEKEPHPTLNNENYYIPIMTLNKNVTARLTLKVDFNIINPKIKIKYDATNFTLNIQELDFTNEITEGATFITGSKEIQFEITSTSNRNQISYIEFHIDDPNETFVGRIKIIPNSTSKNLDAVFIKVKTRLNFVEKIKTGSIFNREVNHTEKVLSQSNIGFTYKLAELDLIDDSGLASFSEYRDGQNILKVKKAPLSTTTIFDYLESKVDISFSSYYRIYIFDEAVYDDDSNQFIWGRAKDLNSKGILLCSAPHSLHLNNRPSALLVHELLHAMGLRHSFDKAAQFSYFKHKTNNILDYSYQISQSAIETWQWQWAKLNPSLASYIIPKANTSI